MNLVVPRPCSILYYSLTIWHYEVRNTSKRDENNHKYIKTKQPCTVPHTTGKLFAFDKIKPYQDITQLSTQQTMVNVFRLLNENVCFVLLFLSWIIHYNKSSVYSRVCAGYGKNIFLLKLLSFVLEMLIMTILVITTVKMPTN